MDFFSSNYQLLANAIVAQAAKDYQAALCRSQDAGCTVQKLEDFFTGDQIKCLTKVDGPALMARLKQEVIDNDYDLKKIKKSHFMDSDYDEYD